LTSEKKIEANRRNARRSTGPRSAEGKARSRLNAVSHGLSAQLSAVIGAEEIARIADMVAPPDAAEPLKAAAWRLAQGEVLLDRCRMARAAIAAQASPEAPLDPAVLVDVTARLQAIDRYERRARREITAARAMLAGETRGAGQG
jgi:beta-galactosidase GanA